jgi:hypothetical protein
MRRGSATEDRIRSLAMYAEHRALGLPSTADQVQALMMLYGGVLLSLVIGPPEAVSRPAVLVLARCLVNGVLISSPAAGELRSP